MVPWLLDRAPYTPFADPHLVRVPGMLPLGDLPLAVVDADFGAQMAERERLLQAVRATVVDSLPGGEAPARELLELLVAGVRAPFATDGAVWHRPDGGSVPLDRDDPLGTLGRMTAEDWCLLLPDPEAGEYRLVSAVLCFPSRWSLAQKLGRPLTAIHTPVPDYAEVLARRVNRIFDGLRPERPVWRVNWLVHAHTDLYMPLREEEKLTPVPVYPETPLYLRTERQTLVRLAETGGVAFGIKTSLSRLETLAPTEAAALVRALGGLDPDVVGYRSGGDLQREALRRCAALAAAEAGA